RSLPPHPAHRMRGAARARRRGLTKRSPPFTRSANVWLPGVPDFRPESRPRKPPEVPMGSPKTPEPETPTRVDLESRLAQLTARDEVARSLLGATEPRVIAGRLLHSGMGILGARSGVLLVAEARDRFRVLYDTLPTVDDDFSLRIPESAREWMRDPIAFP